MTKKTDIALAIHYDGVQAISQSSHSIALVIIINYNLPPTIRYQQRNILALMLIPGPDEPKDLNSFLRPLVDELIELGKGIKARDTRYNRDIILRAYAVIAGGMLPFFLTFFNLRRIASNRFLHFICSQLPHNTLSLETFGSLSY